jgi:hypothetical protein
MNKKYNVTFTEKKKYNPSTRTVLVENCDHPFFASNLIFRQFGKKITIDNVEEVKEENTEEVSV